MPVDSGWRHGSPSEHVRVARALLEGHVVQSQRRGSPVTPKRIGLILPVEASGPARVGLEVVARRPVVLADLGDPLRAVVGAHLPGGFFPVPPFSGSGAGVESSNSLWPEAPESTETPRAAPTGAVGQ